MIRFVSSFFGGIFSWVTTAVFMAALTIGAVLWIYGRDLPSTESLATYQPPTISRIYSTEGRIIDEFARERRLFVPSEEIPDLIKQAFISAEDKNFYEHRGFDPRALVGAARDIVVSRGETLRGGSGITQQVMKNFLLSGDRTVERKIKELVLAARVEGVLDKEEILELYLNEIDLGFLSFGVAAAAQTYFNKSLDELSVAEAAYLAALPKATYSYHPVHNREAAVARRDYVLREMRENGYLTEDAYAAAKATPLRTVQNGDFESFRTELPDRDYFSDEIRRQLSRDFGEEQFFTGGMTVRATVDPEMQRVAALALQSALEEFDRSRGLWRGTGQSIPAEALGDWRTALAAVPDLPRDVELDGGWFPAVVLEVGAQDARLGIEGVEGEDNVLPAQDVQWARKLREDGSRGPAAQVAGDLVEVGDVVMVRRITSDSDGSFVRWSLRQVPEVQGGLMAMDVNSGRVLAMQGGFSYQDSTFNRSTQALRQPGSAFKPFVYAAALDSGFTPATIVVDGPIEIDTPQGIWRPKNASNRYYGPTPLRTGIEQSRNLMTVRLANEIGMDTVAGYAERFGVYDEMRPYLANALGAEETTLFQMVAAYAMFANGGERVEPTLVDRVQDRFGRTVYRHDGRNCVDCEDASLAAGAAPRIFSDRERVMDSITAYQLTSMMQGVVERGTARGTIGSRLGVPVAGKTGTTNDEKDAWFVGFTSNIVAGCYIGYDQPRAMGRGQGGGTLCGPVFAEFMQAAVEKYGGSAFEVPPGGQFVKIDRFTGARLSDGAVGDNVVAEYFREGEMPVFGLLAAIDGGWAIGDDLPLFEEGASDLDPPRQVRTSTGRTVTVAPRASFGSLSSGGLY